MSPTTTIRPLEETAEAGSKHLQDVLASSLFKNAPVLSGLLLYLWQNRHHGFSEYAIAVDALGRRPEFETKTDATVRVQISRLRKLLQKYYESDGLLSPVRIAIPLGTHQVQLIEGPAETAASSPDGTSILENVIQSEAESGMAIGASVRQPLAVRHPLLVPAMAATIAILLLSIGVLVWWSAHRAGSLAATSSLPAFWREFSDNGRSLRIVLPVPIFFTWPLANGGTLLARDTGISSFANGKDSAAIVELEERLGRPRPWQSYANVSDAFAALQLMRFLDRHGIRASISSSTESPQGIIDHENIVVFGSTTLMGQYQSDIDRLSFSLAPHDAYVVDKRLPANSPVQFPAQHESGSRSVQPGLVALLPRGSSASRILILEGAQTSALIAWLTSEDGMREMEEARASAKAKGPYFEAIVLSEVNGENSIQSRLVAFRPFVPSGS